MTHCPGCHREVRPGANFCGTCGLRLLGNTPARHGAAGDLASGSLLAGRYRLEAPAAAGAMGTVWRARDERLHGRLCAIKTVMLAGATPEEGAERLSYVEREAALLATLRHPAICTILDLVTVLQQPYLVMEWIDGHTLAEALTRHGNPGLPEEQVRGWVSALAGAFDYLHGQTPPVIVRDIKPQNIMLRADGAPVLIDFGIARRPAPGSGTAIGTPGYAPPEQYQGVVDVRSDVYALAAAVHHLLTGRDPSSNTPFVFPPVRALVPELSPEVEVALARALQLPLDQRFASVAAFVAAWHTAPTPRTAPPERRAPPLPTPVDPAGRFDLLLLVVGTNKIGAIKALRELISGLSLKEAKDLAEGAPRLVKVGVSLAEAEMARARLMAAGAVARIQPHDGAARRR